MFQQIPFEAFNGLPAPLIRLEIPAQMRMRYSFFPLIAHLRFLGVGEREESILGATQAFSNNTTKSRKTSDIEKLDAFAAGLHAAVVLPACHPRGERPPHPHS